MSVQLQGAEVAQRMVEVHAALAAAADEDEIMQAIVLALAPFAPDNVDFSRMHTDALGEPHEIEVVRIWRAGAIQATHAMYGRRFALQASPFGHALLRDSMQAHYVADATADPATAAELAELPRPVRGVAVLPLYSRRHGAWQGVIVVQWSEPHEPDVAERLLHALLIHAVAEAMASEQARERNEALLREVQEALMESQRQRDMWAALFEHLPVGVAMVRDDAGPPDLINPTGRAALGLDGDMQSRVAAPPQLFHADSSLPIMPADRPEARALRTGMRVREEVEALRPDGTRVVFDVIAVPLQAGAGATRRAIVLFHDLTQMRRIERERLESREELLRVQAAALAERSTPLIPIRDDVLVMPLIGAIDREREQQILETLVGFGGRTRVRAVILDLTGVRSVDAAAAAALLGAARAVRLRGVRPLLTGIQPAVASALVALAVDFGPLEVFGSLQDAVARATRG